LIEDEEAVSEHEIVQPVTAGADDRHRCLRAARVRDVTGAAMITGYFLDGGGQDLSQVSPVVARQQAEKDAAQTVGIPGDTVAAYRLGSGDAGTVQQHRGPRNGPGEILVRLAGVPGTSCHADVHAATP
jgi:hypothetical protein